MRSVANIYPGAINCSATWPSARPISLNCCDRRFVCRMPALYCGQRNGCSPGCVGSLRRLRGKGVGSDVGQFAA